MKTILVTGGGGMIGDHLCSGFLKKGYEVVAVDRKTSSYNLNKAHFTFVQASPLDKDAYADTMLRYSPDIVIHMACTADNDLNNIITETELKENARCNEFIYQLALTCKVKQFILVSTTQVYQIPKTREPIHEDDFTKPVTNYAKLKTASEEALAEQIGRGKGILCAIIRLAPVYTKEYYNNLESKITDPKDNSKFIYRTGDYGFHMCCVHNFVDAMLNFAIEAEQNPNLAGVYNMADKNLTSASEIIDYMKTYHRLGIVLQRNAPNTSITAIRNLIDNKELKVNYRFLDFTKILNNTTFDITKISKFCSFRWNIHNTK
ncbi:MAG: NAD(P)-dependent oxidoreductase [Oscillospiraceae bacterium]|nr:NAD(P)-dependent oxidoreductase [Oscillospiraceae bacterium]